MRRHFFNFLVGVSLLLFVATCTMWVRSHWVGDNFEYEKTKRRGTERVWRRVRFSSAAGGLRFDYGRQWMSGVSA